MPKGVYERKPRLRHERPALTCSAPGCGAASRTPGSTLCEKHYGRIRRNGTLENRVLPEVIEHSHGYLLRYAPNHPLAKRRGVVRDYEHRLVFYDAHGEGPFSCHVCCAEVTWDDMHVDHLDDEKKNNDPANLAAACPTCNQARGIEKMRTTVRERRATWIEHDGERRTLAEWADRIGVTRNALKARIENGWPLADALGLPRGRFGPARKGEIKDPVESTPRAYMSPQRRDRIFAAAGGICAWCRLPIVNGEAWIADHRIALALGGSEDDANLEPLHATPCNKLKTAADITAIAKAKRRQLKHTGQAPPPTQPIRSRNTFKRRWQGNDQ